MADNSPVDVNRIGKKLSKRRAALARMVKEYNRLSVTKENPDLTKQVYDTMKDTQEEIEDIFNAARPQIEASLQKKRESLRKLQQAFAISGPDDRHMIKKKMKAKRKMIKNLTGAASPHKKASHVDEEMSPVIQTDEMQSDGMLPVVQSGGMSPVMQSNKMSPVMQSNKMSPVMQGYGMSPVVHSEQLNMGSSDEMNSACRVDGVLIECHLNDSTYWLSPVCVNFTSTEGRYCYPSTRE